MSVLPSINVEMPELAKLNAKRSEFKHDYFKFLEKNFDDELKCRTDSQTINAIIQITADWAVSMLAGERAEAIKEFVAEMKRDEYGIERSTFLDALEEIG
jgi:hypothetical protein